MLLYLLGEILAFCMPGVFGSSIRSRLMPRNENYPAFLAEVKLPALIADHDLAPICRSFMPQEVTPRGCALWTVDECALHGLRFGIRRAPLSDADGERGERRVMYMDMMYTPLGTLLRVLSAILFLGEMFVCQREILLRRLTEDAGGGMTLESAPCFRMTLLLPRDIF